MLSLECIFQTLALAFTSPLAVTFYAVNSNIIGGKYEIIDTLGQGASSTVYAGKNVRTGRRVAIKSLRTSVMDRASDPEFRRFEQEARIAGSIESPHIAQVFDIDSDPETQEAFLVMELLDGEDLDALLNRVGALPPNVALCIAAEACRGLEAAHALGVVHRDIKPGNLFLARLNGDQLVVKILDFGLAKIRPFAPDELNRGLTAPSTPLTATGQLLGSPLFMSPEHVEGAKHVDAQSDVYSLGVTLYAMLAGTPPHADCKSFVQLLHLITSAKHPPLQSVAPWVPADVAAIVDKAMRVSRAERYSNAAAMRAAIMEILPHGFSLHKDLLVSADRTPLVAPPSEGLKKDSAEPTKSKEIEARAAARSGSRKLVIGLGAIFVLVVAVILMKLVQG